MTRRVGWLLVAVLAFSLVWAPTSYADDQPKNKGLFVTPTRAYIDVTAGQSSGDTMTIANITDRPMTVTLSVEQFSVADYTYDYAFTQVKEDWIKFQSSLITLQPGKSEHVSYAVIAPADAAPGGHYFTLFATTSLEGTAKSTVKVATVLYLTVGGQLQRTTEIQKETTPWISFGGDIPFSFDVKNTGNTHFFAYAAGKVNGPFAQPETTEETHILLPAAVRTIGGSMTSPVLPGIYEAVYGYKTDDGQTVNRSKYIVYLPLWALAIPLGVSWVGVVVVKRRRNAIDSLPQRHR